MPLKTLTGILLLGLFQTHLFHLSASYDIIMDLP